MTDSNDDWQDWKPDWSFKSNNKKNKSKNRKTTINSKTPHEFQEQHSPTTTIELKISNKRKTAKYQQRIVDARLWSKMSPSQQDAALAIDRAFGLMCKGIGYKISAPHLPKISHSHKNNAEFESEIINTYFEWVQQCKAKNLSHSASIDIIVYGKTCKETDRNRRVRNGWARKNLLDCLNIYCKINGWPLN